MIKVSDDFTLMIDYAHNAMSLESLFDDIKRISSKETGMSVSGAAETVQDPEDLRWEKSPEDLRI